MFKAPAKAKFLIRPARKDECRRIAELYSAASNGVADYIWSTLAEPGEDFLEVGQRRYERVGTVFSYENCTMVELDDRAIGLLVAFPMEVDADREEPDPVMVPYRVLEEDQSYYVCGIAIDAEHRGKGIGTQLMAEAEKSCRELGLKKLSLIVFEQNMDAKRLYERLGYAETRRYPVVPHPLIRSKGYALLMVKDI